MRQSAFQVAPARVYLRPRVRNNDLVHAAFGTVLWVVCIVAAILALVALIASSKTWEDFGKNGLLLESELRGSPASGSAAALRERDEEIRQMLEARNARRIRRGEEPLDVEQELGRLVAPPAADPELRSEVRGLVLARNYRRVRAGKPPLDVEAEVERELAKLGDLSSGTAGADSLRTDA